ncbi:MAG: DSBA oxidoreductase [Candidatus Magasanikbacteria bacterium GW2011_GWD2_43_18]|uniref:DSBA oxidoreductase n=1 Tax=Candidatus Magasanikbacteria bacterium GW2011_GWE2_42_7 TaxID=1619052 RepID=A0A0G1BDP4_9BACT|nr:MAG: DSBA oxidoreductase [Candidatus Magasanikbacteria bacterium GW2011_GWC2_42_27]KKS71299.1 MAG: DSBA oxidoreductase [Candidatus Magasanikbacteria bacterium GW2011_GWE2_42_7]KKT03769.1 MAG: DSBA oxidoreductase [Candidatus Magasanikbacteria bacterium GW2011_GWD2_43_18]
MIPAIFLVAGIFMIRIWQYNSLSQSRKIQSQQNESLDLIPILPDDPIIGSPSSPKTIVVFEDLACAGCKIQDTFLKQVQQQHPGKVKIIWKGLPVIPYPYPSEVAHEYAFCAHKQGKFEVFKEYAFVNNTNLTPTTLVTISNEIELDQEKLSACLDSNDGLAYIDTIQSLATILHVQSVPTFFVDNTQIATPNSVAEWEIVLGL